MYCRYSPLTVKLLKQLFPCCAASLREQLHCLQDEGVRCRSRLGAQERIGGRAVDLLRLQKDKNKNYTLPFQSIDTIVTSLPFTMNHAKVKVTMRQHNDVPFLETLTRVRTSMHNT